ncbi:hypothetical protein HanHA300_Chr17g0636151 [Helianthus annuus]|nr:hypothetical protein HanHA300_Chr17g0636151 [Helianthus annuus]KAJ0634627.1 hypothetical protein HanOQP8_Chr17g0642111 [Helianthus annuus]
MSKDVMARFLNKRKTIEIGSSSDFVDVNDLPSDPHDRKAIASYNVNQRDDVRRAYLLRGPCQPTGIKFKFDVLFFFYMTRPDPNRFFYVYI